MIRALVLDIDGVLTDGEVSLDASGGEAKVLFFRDLDALARARAAGMPLALVTGEDGELADVIAKKLSVAVVLKGAKDKEAALREVCGMLGVSEGETCYVGDSDRDAPAIALAGLGLAPADASARARRSARFVLEARGGRGAVAEALETLHRVNEDGARPIAPSEGAARAMIEAALEESITVKREVLRSLAGLIATAAEWMTEAILLGNKVLLMGNGGSAADAQHIAAELVGRFESDRRPLPAVALTTDTSVLTAIANDYGVEEVFARQLRGLAVPGDLVIAFSTSGNSPNVVEAVKAARGAGIRTIALTGESGGRLAPLADLALRVPSRRPARIQESHIAIGHAMCEVVDAAVRP